MTAGKRIKPYLSISTSGSVHNERDLSKTLDTLGENNGSMC